MPNNNSKTYQTNLTNPDGSPKYISLLRNVVKLTNWDEPQNYNGKPRGRKPKPIKKPVLDPNKPRNNKFFKF